jgi:paired amphipathic helix protein Sin3a
VIVELLRKSPVVALPTIIMRLEGKDKEWRIVRESMNRLWRKVYEANYHKSLDHRSFIFKQQDKKNLTPRAMLAVSRLVNVLC